MPRSARVCPGPPEPVTGDGQGLKFPTRADTHWCCQNTAVWVTGLALAFALCEAKHVGPQPFVFTLRTNPCVSGREQEVGKQSGARTRCQGSGHGAGSGAQPGCEDGARLMSFCSSPPRWAKYTLLRPPPLSCSPLLCRPSQGREWARVGWGHATASTASPVLP